VAQGFRVVQQKRCQHGSTGEPMFECARRVPFTAVRATSRARRARATITCKKYIAPD